MLLAAKPHCEINSKVSLLQYVAQNVTAMEVDKTVK